MPNLPSLLSDFDYFLPEELIAQTPARPRESARLLRAAQNELSDHIIADLPQLLRSGDLLVHDFEHPIGARFYTHVDRPESRPFQELDRLTVNGVHPGTDIELHTEVATKYFFREGPHSALSDGEGFIEKDDFSNPMVLLEILHLINNQPHIAETELFRIDLRTVCIWQARKLSDGIFFPVGRRLLNTHNVTCYLFTTPFCRNFVCNSNLIVLHNFRSIVFFSAV